MTTDDYHPEDKTFLRWPEVQRITGICRSHAHSLAAKGEFPTPIKLGKRSSAWIYSEVLDWVESKISASRPEQRD